MSLLHTYFHVLYYEYKPVTYSPAYKHILKKILKLFTFSFYIFTILRHIPYIKYIITHF